MVGLLLMSPFLRSFLLLGTLCLMTTPEVEAASGAKLSERERRELEEAARYVCTATCGFSLVGEPGKARLAKLNAAGAELPPVLADLVARPDFPDFGVDRAAGRAAKLPYSQALHDALRRRRPAPGLKKVPDHLPMGLFNYFAQHGDTIDYVWMEKWRGRLGSKAGAPLDPLLKAMIDRLGG